MRKIGRRTARSVRREVLGPPHVLEDRGQRAVQPGWQLLVVTDGLYEARTPDGEALGDRLGMEALADLVGELVTSTSDPQELLDVLFQRVVAGNGGHLDDDAAALWCGPRP